MVKHIPIKFKLRQMVDYINEQGFEGTYDYFYMPQDSNTKCNVGYGFINFIDPIYVVKFFLKFELFDWKTMEPFTNSKKICRLAMANV